MTVSPTASRAGLDFDADRADAEEDILDVHRVGVLAPHRDGGAWPPARPSFCCTLLSLK